MEPRAQGSDGNIREFMIAAREHTNWARKQTNSALPTAQATIQTAFNVEQYKFWGLRQGKNKQIQRGTTQLWSHKISTQFKQICFNLESFYA